jgi:hypothetical protein
LSKPCLFDARRVGEWYYHCHFPERYLGSNATDTSRTRDELDDRKETVMNGSTLEEGCPVDSGVVLCAWEAKCRCEIQFNWADR